MLLCVHDVWVHFLAGVLHLHWRAGIKDQRQQLRSPVVVNEEQMKPMDDSRG